MKLKYIEIFSALADPLVYWHQNALGFNIIAEFKSEKQKNKKSYILRNGNVTLIITSFYPVLGIGNNIDFDSFVNKNHIGVKNIIYECENLELKIQSKVELGAILKSNLEYINDELGEIIKVRIKLFDDNEIILIDSSKYKGDFLPGYVKVDNINKGNLQSIDHITGELRINETKFWSNYLSDVFGFNKIQDFQKKLSTGVGIKVNKDIENNLYYVISEPYDIKSKIFKDLLNYGSGIHHLAFSTNNIYKTLDLLSVNKVKVVDIPEKYYNVLREKKEFEGLDIDKLEKYGLIVDKKDGAVLLQKFIKPMTERPYFFYEIVQRINDFEGFSVSNTEILTLISKE